MDKEKPENKIFYWYKQKRGHNPYMDCVVHLLDAGVNEISIQIDQKYAADIVFIAAQFV